MEKYIFIFLLCLISTANVDIDKYRKDCLERHNYYRSLHQAGKVKSDQILEKAAMEVSDLLAFKIKDLVHTEVKMNGDYVGQNLYMCYGISETIGSDCVNMWYGEVDVYDFNNQGFSMGTRHFTQVVWKSVKKIGLGVSCDNQQRCYVVCHYYPSGNNEGQYYNNVFPKDGKVYIDDSHDDEKDNTYTSGSSSTSYESSTTYEGSSSTTKYSSTSSNNISSESGSSSTSSDPLLEKFREDILARHNYYRKKHQVANLKRDSKLEKIAQNSADIMKSTNNWYFTEEKYKGQYIGQNLFWSWGISYGYGIVDTWYNDGLNYDYDNQGWYSQTAQFTQLIWKSTKKIGCGVGCNGYECYGVCVYYPVGNMGDFSENVFPSK